MNALSQQTQEEILILAESGYSFREIAKKLHIKRHTVSWYKLGLELNEKEKLNYMELIQWSKKKFRPK